GPSSLYSWQGTGGSHAPAPAPEAAEEQAPVPAGGLRIGVAPVQDGPLPTYVAPNAPHVVSIPRAENVRSVSVRIEGDDFRVGSSLPLRTIPGNAERLEIRTDGPPIDLVLQLPEHVAGFMLK